MKKITVLILAVMVSLLAFACVSPPPPPPPPPPGLENPGAGPKLTVVIPEIFSPNPDIADDTMTISIKVEHAVPVREWSIQIQPNRRRSGTERPETEQTTTRRRETRQAFFEQNGTGDVPGEWKWNGKGLTGEMVQSAMDYRFTLSVNDVFSNNSTYEGIISTDVLVKREGDILRIIVPSIVFQGNSANFSEVFGNEITEDIVRGNRRILNLIARALTRFDDYKITVEGHTNPGQALGSAARNRENTANHRISEQRAEAVVNYLVTNNNIDKARLTSVGMSATRTITEDYHNDEENWKNRRVEFILHK